MILQTSEDGFFQREVIDTIHTCTRLTLITLKRITTIRTSIASIILIALIDTSRVTPLPYILTIHICTGLVTCRNHHILICLTLILQVRREVMMVRLSLHRLHHLHRLIKKDRCPKFQPDQLLFSVELLLLCEDLSGINVLPSSP